MTKMFVLPADKARVTVVMDKEDYFDKTFPSANDKETHEPLKRDPTPALQRRLNKKLFDLKKNDTIDIQLYYRVRCRVPQPPKPHGLPKLHKPNIPMRPIVSFCGPVGFGAFRPVFVDYMRYNELQLPLVGLLAIVGHPVFITCVTWINCGTL